MDADKLREKIKNDRDLDCEAGMDDSKALEHYKKILEQENQSINSIKADAIQEMLKDLEDYIEFNFRYQQPVSDVGEIIKRIEDYIKELRHAKR